jgi:hypothetical protein
MRVKRPGDLKPGDVLWRWQPRGPAIVRRVEPRGNGTALVWFVDGQSVEVYTKQIVT